MATAEEVTLRVDDGVGVLELRRPEKRNAITPTMWSRLAQECDQAARSGAVRALVVRGAGDAFCAGADLGSLATDEDGRHLIRSLVDAAVSALATFPAPTVAEVHGACIGGGCSIALACDTRVASTDAVFSIPAARHGLVYDETSATRLTALVGTGIATRMLCAGQTLDGREAWHAGLVEECTTDLRSRTSALAQQIAARDPSVVAPTLALVRGAAGRPTQHSALPTQEESRGETP